MKITGRIELDKNLTLDELDSLVEDVRGVAYPVLDIDNQILLFDIELRDIAQDPTPLCRAAVIALDSMANALHIPEGDARWLVERAVSAAEVWQTIEDACTTRGIPGPEVVE